MFSLIAAFMLVLLLRVAAYIAASVDGAKFEALQSLMSFVQKGRQGGVFYVCGGQAYLLSPR